MPYVTSDVIVTPGFLFYSDDAAADIPDEATKTVATPSQPGGWIAPWEQAGYTSEPINMSSSFDTFELEVQQEVLPIVSVIVSSDLTITTTLAEFRSDLMAILFGNERAAAAGPALPANPAVTAESITYRIESRTALKEWKIGLEGTYMNNNAQAPIRIYLPKATIIQNGDISFDKQGVLGLPVQIRALPDQGVSAIIQWVLN